MNPRFACLFALVALVGLSACGSIQYREGRGTYCRMQSDCPWENS